MKQRRGWTATVEEKKTTEIRKEGDRVVTHVCGNLMERTDTVERNK